MALTRAETNVTLHERSQLSFRILDLPAEFLGGVCDHLPNDNLMNVRRVCRALNAHSSTAFGQRFFRHLITILHPTSLTTLYEICRHPVLSKFVHQVTVSGERIGHAISPLENEEAHKDLQTSVEQSGMDVLILTKVFRSSIIFKTFGSMLRPFMRMQNILSPSPPKKSWDKGDDNGFNRVYALAIQALEKASAHDKVELCLDFWNSLGGDQVVSSFFDLESSYWRNHLSKKLRGVFVMNDINEDWFRRLLSTASGITCLDLCWGYQARSLSHELGGTLNWPGLRRIDLQEMVVHQDELVGLLRQHAPILEALHFNWVGFPRGTWAEPLKVMQTMPRLKDLYLYSLLEQAPYPESSEVFRSSDNYIGDVHLRTNEQVKAALSAMRNHLRTVFTGRDLESDDGIHYRYPYMVDFEIAEAAAYGEASYHDGQFGSGYVSETEYDEDDIECEDEDEAENSYGGKDADEDKGKHEDDREDRQADIRAYFSVA